MHTQRTTAPFRQILAKARGDTAQNRYETATALKDVLIDCQMSASGNELSKFASTPEEASSVSIQHGTTERSAACEGNLVWVYVLLNDDAETLVVFESLRQVLFLHLWCYTWE